MRSALLPILLLASLAACGSPAPRDQAAPSVSVQPADFGDVDPTDWQGNGPSGHPVHGIDISRWQGAVDWPTARAAGVNFAYMKATEGGDGLDPMFKENWRAAARAGVPRGAYHFFYHCRPGVEQARWFIRNVPRSAGALPPVLDIEWTPFSPTCTRRPPAAEVRAEAEAFMTALERHYGQAPLIYTTPDFYQENELWRLRGHEFWLRSVAAHPSETYAGQHWTFWQYTGTGTVPGIVGKTDINVFAGTAPAWGEWLAARAQ
ncbi:glycoside hydrolase family 25 protein [Rhodobacter ferrooxidans]|uniref:Glycoside hydrolase family 25 n=1 Tax=Rhodobacter ferrooxidans TaxID=371731 RepID=C8S2G3_9RHOB|nr:GH25 family lysozyme [Rhodobacter sp. SW2]EEW24834.1 glycoside hydrolase family 25 [Rhodobacter sp. SW2]